MRTRMTAEERQAVARQILTDLMHQHRFNDVRGIVRAIKMQWHEHVTAHQAQQQPTGPAPEKEQSNEQ